MLLSELFSWGLLGMSTIPGYCQLKYLQQPTISSLGNKHTHQLYLYTFNYTSSNGINIGIIYMSGCTISLSHFCCWNTSLWIRKYTSLVGESDWTTHHSGEEVLNFDSNILQTVPPEKRSQRCRRCHPRQQAPLRPIASHNFEPLGTQPS
jgi:hypothetical protein